MSDNYSPALTDIDIPGSDSDLTKWAETVVTVQDRLEANGFDIAANRYGDRPNFEDADDWLDHYTAFRRHPHRPRYQPDLAEDLAPITQEGDHEDIMVGTVVDDTTASPVVVAKNEHGYGALQPEEADIEWYNRTDESTMQRAENGPFTVMTPAETPGPVRVLYTPKRDDFSEEGIATDEDRIMDYITFLEDVSYEGYALGQFEVDIAPVDDPDAVADRLEAVYTGLKEL